MKDKDFSGITINCGIDVHLKQWNVSVYVENKLFRIFQQESSAEKLHRYLVAKFPNGTYKSAYECGYFGFYEHRRLEELGINNIVINAADVPTKDKERKRKSDKMDARKIGRHLANGDLDAIYIPSEEAQADRSIVRYRINKSRKELTKIKQQIKAFLIQRGIRYYEYGDGRSWTKAFVRWIEQIELKIEEDNFIKDQYIRQYKEIRENQKRLDRKIIEMSREEKYKDKVEILRTIPGVGLLTSMVLITEIININRFPRLDEFCSYFGIVPDVEQSDKTEKIKGMTKRTNKEVRRIIIQASWVASGKAPDLAIAYHRWTKKEKMKAQKAIVKVARKLLSIVRALLQKGEKYEPKIG